MAPKSPMTRRSSCQNPDRILEDEDVVQGRILWLPPKAELPEGSVTRAHGKEPVEDGMYNHPVIVCSRPRAAPGMVHFNVITSFGGKKLDEVYPKSNDFSISRRSWYLPISPAPDHPDATYKRAKKRLPTLTLRDGAVLRWNSYVNRKDVYQIPWAHLRAYVNPDRPSKDDYCMERSSFDRMLSSCSNVFNYWPDHQVHRPITVDPRVDSIHLQVPMAITASPQAELTPRRDSLEPQEPVSLPSLMQQSEEDVSLPKPTTTSPSLHSTCSKTACYQPSSKLYQSTDCASTSELTVSKRYGTMSTTQGNANRSSENDVSYAFIQNIFSYLLSWPWSLFRRSCGQPMAGPDSDSMV